MDKLSVGVFSLLFFSFSKGFIVDMGPSTLLGFINYDTTNRPKPPMQS